MVGLKVLPKEALLSVTEDIEREEWSIDDATAMFQSSEEGNYWKVTFQEGVNFIEDIFSGYYHDKTPKEYLDYAARYDLTFLTPCSRQVRCKVSLFTIAINVIGACFYNSQYLNGPEARNQSLKNSEADSGSSPFFSLANSFISLFSKLFEPLS